MTLALTVLNGLATLFSLWWLGAHVRVRVGDWEFWFALGYLVVCAVNFAYFARAARTRGRGS